MTAEALPGRNHTRTHARSWSHDWPALDLLWSTAAWLDALLAAPWPRVSDEIYDINRRKAADRAAGMRTNEERQAMRTDALYWHQSARDRLLASGWPPEEVERSRTVLSVDAQMHRVDRFALTPVWP